MATIKDNVKGIVETSSITPEIPFEPTAVCVRLLPTGYVLVPWANWDEWNLVRELLFSSSPGSIAIGLRRIKTWSSRGCLPVAIQLTASIIEIHQQDPFFSKGSNDNTITSGDMLAMLYAMAITRFVNRVVQRVNGFDNTKIKNAPQFKRHSIFEIAVLIGIPRLLVDIRHESSHDELPSLPLLRHASTKAIEWLHSHYWEPQRRMIPNAKKAIRRILHQMEHYMKVKHDDRVNVPQIKRRRIKQPTVLNTHNKLSSQITQRLISSKKDGYKKQISKNCKIIARLYSVYPLEIVQSLLEMYMLQTPIGDPSMVIDANSDVNSQTAEHFDAFREIIMEVSRKKPGLLLTVIKEALGMIEKRDTLHERGDHFLLSSENDANICEIKHLSSLVSWLVTKLDKLRKSDQIRFADEPQNLSELTNIIPRVSLTEILRTCLHLSASGNKQLSSSAMFLADMTADKGLIERLGKLTSARSELDFSLQEFTGQDMGFNLSKEENYINRAATELEALKSRMNETIAKVPAANDGNVGSKKRWTLAKSWTSCPIGMLPCPFGSVPILDRENDVPDKKGMAVIENVGKMGTALGKRECRCESDEQSETASPPKKLLEMRENVNGDSRENPSPMEGMMLIGGGWRKVGEDEIHAIKSNIKILVN